MENVESTDVVLIPVSFSHISKRILTSWFPYNTAIKMHSFLFFLLAGLASASPLAGRQEATTASSTLTISTASASTSASTAAVTATPLFPIHKSCNSTLSRQLSRAFEETVELAEHARDHILRWGTTSPLVQKYFGGNTTIAPLGVYSRVVSADRGNMTFRCDDPDENCATQEGLSL